MVIAHLYASFMVCHIACHRIGDIFFSENVITLLFKYQELYLRNL